uniref:Uncharacterized protein n=1 Tax=Arundo donax TaxID=35708 RepID=A0A0A9AX85_ARUDO
MALGLPCDSDEILTREILNGYS